MKLVAVSRLRNEEDILEAFVRHHAGWLHAHIFIDNGSTDLSPRILLALRDEGLPIVLFRNPSGVPIDLIQNTLLYRMAGLELAADWVLPLDCDEFLTLRDRAASLEGALGAVPPEVACVRLPVLTYVAALPGTADRRNAVERLVCRRAGVEAFGKICLRGSLPDALVGQGSHSARIGGVVDEGMAQAAMTICHFPERSPWQAAVKNVLGRLKAVAAGRAALDANWGQHYAAPSAAIGRDLAAWLAEAEATMSGRAATPGLVADPIPYRGGPLRHTAPQDDATRAVASLIGRAEALAIMLGHAHDLSTAVQDYVARHSGALERVF